MNDLLLDMNPPLPSQGLWVGSREDEDEDNARQSDRHIHPGERKRRRFRGLLLGRYLDGCTALRKRGSGQEKSSPLQAGMKTGTRTAGLFAVSGVE